MNNRFIRIFTAVAFFIVAIVFLTIENKQPDKPKYYHNQGQVFGTYYNIRYSAKSNLEKQILASFEEFDNSLSTFNKKSVISRINTNENDSTDAFFRAMFSCAKETYEISEGAFDPTVAPIVNLWGFGFRKKEQATERTIDSLLQFVGFDKVWLKDERLVKATPEIMLDASAIAKGQACDVIAELLRENDCRNYLVDIGGEIVCQGVNNKGEAWKVGINKPVDDKTGSVNELQEIIQSSALCMATSGNYRQFYYEEGQKRSHTIDPRTGYPVKHNLLSATVIAPTCMQADAMATACMVLGEEKALQMTESIENTECYLIYAQGDSTKVMMSQGMAQYIQQ